MRDALTDSIMITLLGVALILCLLNSRLSHRAYDLLSFGFWTTLMVLAGISALVALKRNVVGYSHNRYATIAPEDLDRLSMIAAYRVYIPTG